MKIRVLFLILCLVLLTGCQGVDLPGLPQAEKLEALSAGTYTGVFIIKSSPLLEYGQKALDDPESLPEVTGENAEACEDFDLNDEEVRKQVTEALDKGKATIDKEIPLTIVITEGEGGTFTSTVKVDFAAAFPDEGCEPATDETYTLVHEPGKINLTMTQEQEGENFTSIFEGKILTGGILEGTFKFTSNNKDYMDYTKTDTLIEGTWKATKSE